MIQLFSYIILILPILTHTLPKKEQCQSSLNRLTEDQKLNFSIDSLPFSSRTQNTLQYNNILTLRDLTQHTEKTLLSVPQLGKGVLTEIKHMLAQFGLSLREEYEIIIPLSRLKQLSTEQQLNTPISHLPLRIKIKEVLKTRHILILKNLTQNTEKDLLLIPNLGRLILAEIKNFLAQIGLSLREEYTIPTFNQLSKEEQLNTLIHSLPFSSRTKNTLHHIPTLGDLIQNTEKDLLHDVPNLGKKKLDEIKNFLAQIGLSLREEH